MPGTATPAAPFRAGTARTRPLRTSSAARIEVACAFPQEAAGQSVLLRTDEELGPGVTDAFRNPGPEDSNGRRMTASERRASMSLAGIFTLRILGLFLILPVFSLHAESYQGYTPLLAGLVIGVYGLTQAIFQIPFGMLSDRIGRKKVISAGLLIFVAGSVVAALADTMWGVIAGRALQGLGAIGAAVIALTADLTREDQRTKAMAIIGVSIGFAFALAMMIGHALTSLVGISGLFWLTAVLGVAGLVVLHKYVPTPVSTRFHRDVEPMPAQFREILADRELLRLDGGIFVLHLILTATFVALPLALRDSAGLSAEAHWMVYVPVLLASVLLMIPFVLYADRRNRLKVVFLGAIACLAAAELGIGWSGAGLMALVALMVLFFTSFSVLESCLPSLVSRIAPSDKKGTALGFYSTSQYLGAFAGGLCGGWLHGRWGTDAVFWFCGALVLVWLVGAFGMRNPAPLTTRLLRVEGVTEAGAEDLSRRLQKVRGVSEVVVIVEDAVAYLKVDRRTLDGDALHEISLDAS